MERRFHRSDGRAQGSTGHADRTAAGPSPAGFTLIEIMAVVLIAGLIMSAIGDDVFWQIEKAGASTTRMHVETVGAALEACFLDDGTYPTTEQGLEALRAPAHRSAAAGCLSASRLPANWKRPLRYRFPGDQGPRRFDPLSLGRDDAPGGDEADGGSWETEP